MQQTYAHNFHCEYELHMYPFDTQVGYLSLFITLYVDWSLLAMPKSNTFFSNCDFD